VRIQRELKIKPMRLGGCTWIDNIGVCYRLLEETESGEKIDSSAVYLVHDIKEIRIVLVGVEAVEPGYVRLYTWGRQRGVVVRGGVLRMFLEEAVRVCLDVEEAEARIGLAKALRRVVKQ